MRLSISALGRAVCVGGLALMLLPLSVNAATTATTFSGGDVGEGLDLDGNFVYAANVAGSGGFSIRDATFTVDTATGITVAASGSLSPLTTTANFGGSAGSGNDLAINTVVNSSLQAGFGTGSVADIAVDLAGLTVGSSYKLQLLLLESVDTSRKFDVFFEGSLQTKVADLSINDLKAAQGGIGLDSGLVVTHDFVAGDDTLNILFEGAKQLSDAGPILAGLTLEDTTQGPQFAPAAPEPRTLFLMLLAGGLLIVIRKRRSRGTSSARIRC